MPIVVVGAVHGSPGATSFALDLSRQCGPDTLLIEADPDGGSLAARLDLALKPGLMELAGAGRVGIEADDVWRFAQSTSFGLAVVVAHPAAEQTTSAIRAAMSHIVNAVGNLTCTVIVDVGRLRPGSPSLAAAASADHTLVISDNSVEAIVALTHRARVLQGCRSPLVVMNASRPYSVGDIATSTGQRVWGVVPTSTYRRQDRARTVALERLAIELCDIGRTEQIEFTERQSSVIENRSTELAANA